MIKRMLILIWLMSLIAGAALFAQRSDSERIRREIKGLEAELETQKHLEKSILEKLEDSEHKLGLQKQLLNELERERVYTERRIRMVADSLEITQRGYNRLKGLVAFRMVSIYKRSKYADWAIITSVKSVNQFLVWLKYQKKIIESDRRDLRLLNEKKELIARQQEVLREEKQNKERKIRELSEAEEKLRRLVDSHQSALVSVRRDKKAIQQKLAKRLEAYRVLQGRLREVRTVAPGTYQGLRTNFAQKRGKLIWPVEGRVITKHGRQWNELDDTYVVNRSIEIETKGNETVRAAYDGIVLYIQWLRGLGNVVVVDHGKGYYTSYGQLELVLVENGQQLREGDLLGRIGGRQSLYGSRLEFGVWKEDRDYNPESWLR